MNHRQKGDTINTIIFNFRVEKEKQQLIIEIDSVSSSLDAAVKAKVSTYPILTNY